MPEQMRKPALLLALLGPLFLGACATGASVSFDDMDPSYSSSEVASGVFPLIVRGNPFSIPQASFDQRLAAAMSDKVAGGRTFIPTPAGARAVYRVIMDFQGGAAAPERYCGVVDTLPPNQSPPVPPAPAYGPTRLLAVLCRGDRTLSAAYGTLDALSGPDDPLFRRGIGLFLTRLFPLMNPLDLNEDAGS